MWSDYVKVIQGSVAQELFVVCMQHWSLDYGAMSDYATNAVLQRKFVADNY